MLALILVFLILGTIAFLLRTADFLIYLIIALLATISLFTPFWPIVLLGVFGVVYLKGVERRARDYGKKHHQPFE